MFIITRTRALVVAALATDAARVKIKTLPIQPNAFAQVRVRPYHGKTIIKDSAGLIILVLHFYTAYIHTHTAPSFRPTTVDGPTVRYSNVCTIVVWYDRYLLGEYAEVAGRIEKQWREHFRL